MENVRRVLSEKEAELQGDCSEELVFLYHGTDCHSVESIVQQVKFGPEGHRAEGWDFHLAFYTCEEPTLPMRWAVARADARNMVGRPVVLPAVVGFACPREEWLALNVLDYHTNSHNQVEDGFPWNRVVVDCRAGEDPALDFLSRYDAAAGCMLANPGRDIEPQDARQMEVGDGFARQVAFRETPRCRRLLNRARKFVLLAAGVDASGAAGGGGGESDDSH